MSYLYKCVYAPDHSGIRKEAIGKSFTFIGRKEKEQVSNGIQFITDDVITLYCSELDYFVEIPDSRLSYYFEPDDIEKKEIKEMDKVKRHKELCEELNAVYKQKNQKYGDSYGKSVQKYGLIAALTRISDKFNRFEQIILEGSDGTNDESLIDTCLDAANYFIMTVMELENKK